MSEPPFPAPLSRVRFGVFSSVGVIALTCLLYNRIVFAGEWLSSRDTVRVYYPLAKYWADRVRMGEFPEWYPYNALGQPFVGMMISGAFHPLRLLYLLFPLDVALSIETLLCYPAAALGAYLCARCLGLSRPGRLFAAVTYAFSGYLVGISNNLHYLMAAATFPFVLWGAERAFAKPSIGRLACASLLLTLLIFTGDAQTVAVTAAIILVLSIARPNARPAWHSLVMAVAIVLVGSLIAAPQLLPAWATLREARAGINPVAVAQKFSLHPLRLFELLLGPVFVGNNVGLIAADLNFLNDPAMHSEWVDSIAIGAPAVALGLLGALGAVKHRMGRVFVGAGILLLALCLGRFLPIYRWAYAVVPLWNSFRYPEKLIPFVAFLLALAGGYALSCALENERGRRHALWALGAIAVVAGAAAALEAGVHSWQAMLTARAVGPKTVGPLGEWFVELSGAAATFSTLVLLVLWKVKRRGGGYLVVALQGILLVWMHLSLPQTVGVPLLTEPVGFIPTLQQLGVGKLGGPRVHSGARAHKLPNLKGYDLRELIAVGLFTTMEPDLPALFGIETTFYYLPAGSERVVFGLLHGDVSIRRLAPLYGAKYFTADSTQLAAVSSLQDFHVVGELPDWGMLLLENSAALPRVYVAHPWCTEGREHALKRLESSEFKPGRDALTECHEEQGSSGATADGPAGAAELLSYAPERVEVSVDAGSNAILVLNDAWYSGWQATVDGASAEIEPVNIAVRGVRVPEGVHRVSFTYRQSGLRLGLLIAGITLLTLLGACLFAGRAGSQTTE